MRSIHSSKTGGKYSAIAAAIAMAGSAPAMAVMPADEEEAAATADQQSADEPEVLERDAQGRATKVRLNGQLYDVCTPDQSDGCINPRDAGLDQGNREIKYWPGKPASEIDGPLPVEKPDGDMTKEH